MSNIDAKESKNVGRPAWLVKLEEESWQVELLISGLAIYGTLSLPGYLKPLSEWGLTYFDPGNYVLLYFLFLYLYLICGLLIICFFAHFILRTLWVGLLGLNSVYPNGINYESKFYSPIFMRRLKEEFPPDQSGILQLERASSLIFSIATTGAIVFMCINFYVALLIFLKSLLDGFIPENILSIFGYTLLGLSLVPMVIQTIFNRKKYWNSESKQGFYYKTMMSVNRIFYLPFYRFVTRVSYVFISHIDLKKYSWYIFIIMGVSGFSSAAFLRDNNAIQFMIRNDIFHEQFARTDRFIPQQYEDVLTDEYRILSATIPSKKISGDNLPVFVAVFENEESIYDKRCGVFQNENNLEGYEKRLARWEFYSECLRSYHQILVNDSLYNYDLIKYTHTNRGEDGFKTYLPTDNFKKGKNILTIKKMESDTTAYRTINIPFWF